MALSQRDLGWIAGFLEGEGSFTFHGTALLVSAGQVQRAPLDKLQSLLGGKIHMKPREGRAPWFQWWCAGQRAAGVMLTVYALMSPRRKAQISSALAVWRSRPATKGWRRTLTHCKRGHAFTPENTKLQKNGARNCRECLRMLWRRKHLRVIHGDADRNA